MLLHPARSARPPGSRSPIVALTCGALTALLPRPLVGRPTTYAAASTGATVADLVAGLGLLAAGGLAHVLRPRGSIGPLTVMIGVGWLASDWIGWETAPSLARSVAMVVAPFVLALVVHLAFAFPAGRIGGWVAHSFIAFAYGSAALVSIGRAAFRDPFLDQHCWANCSDNAFLVRPDLGVTRFLDAYWQWSSVVIGVVLALACGCRLARATRVARRALWWMLVPVGLAAVAEAAYALLLLDDPAEDPQRGAYMAVFLTRAGALTALAGGVIWGALRSYRTSRAVARLADDLGETPPPGSLKSALARSLGDDELDVAYWLPGVRRYVDAAGRPVEPHPGPDQAATAIVRRGEPVALIVHDRAFRGADDLAREIGGAARLAVDNERLRAEVLAQLGELRASRQRIVTTGDTARRRLERDLHDGAQQRLLAVSYELRLASAAAAVHGDTALVGLLSTASDETQQALTELRQLAQGIFPAILTDAGLGPALRTLAEHAELPLELLAVVEERYSPASETAAYLVVADALDDAARRCATYLLANVSHEMDRLVIEVHDDGIPSAGGRLIHIGDRVGALGGLLELDGGGLRAEIPCG